MEAGRWRRIEALFDEVADLPADERGGVLAKEGDAEIRAEVERLLASLGGAATALRGAIGAEAQKLVESERVVGTTVGVYRLVSLIGEGGMGAVYLGERADAEYEQRVAVKLLRGGFASTEALARFRDERQILAGLQHPGIVRLLDGGTTERGQPYLVMELVEGRSLMSAIAGASIRDRLALFLRVCTAVQHAHQRLIVHRDLKPSNILVGADGGPKLLDFGIAKLLDPAGAREAETRTGGAPLTPEYASPEQARGEPVTVATDVFSLGAVLFEMLTGRPPHVLDPKAGALVLLRTICEVDPPRASTVARERARELAGDLDNIVAKALAKDPARRYASVAALAEDLQRHLDGLPVLAREATLRYRAGKFARRHRGALAIATLVTAALATTTAISIVSAVRANDEAERANTQAERAERKFSQVRSLANSMFDFDAKLVNVAGAIEARKAMVASALHYLDSLVREAEDDPSLALELAHAYQKVGDIQGNEFEPYLGDATGAQASYAKATSIVERLRTSGRADAELQRFAVRLKLGTGIVSYTKPEQAQPTLVAGIRAYEALHEVSDYDPYVFRALILLALHERDGSSVESSWSDSLVARTEGWDRARSTPETRYAYDVALEFRADSDLLVGDLEHGCASLATATEQLDELSNAHFGDMRFVRERGFARLLHVSCFVGLANEELWVPSGPPDLARAEALLRDAATFYTRLADSHDVREVQNLGEATAELASVVGARDPASAVPIIEHELEMYESQPADFVANDPDRWFFYCPAAEVLARAGKRDRALALASIGLTAAMKSAFDSDAGEHERKHLQMCRYLIAKMYITLGDRDVASRLLSEAAGELESIAASSRWAPPRVGLVEVTDLLATLRPEQACALRARAADAWQHWPAALTPFVEQQRAATAARRCVVSP